jgi:pyruvate/2-oxoglutarate dehydrogenase complex dihydrolipoamide acyltransferase (E2) component
LERWLKKDGERFNAQETICEITVAGVTIGIDVDEGGILAQRLVDDGAVVPVGTQLGIVVDCHESYMTHFENVRQEASDQQKAAEFTEVYESTHEKTSTKVLLKAIKNLIKDNKIIAGSGTSTLFRLSPLSSLPPPLLLFRVCQPTSLPGAEGQ